MCVGISRHIAASTLNPQTHKSAVTTDNECKPIREDWFAHLYINREVMVEFIFTRQSVLNMNYVGQCLSVTKWRPG